MLNKISNLVTVVSLVLVVWFLASWANTLAHNMPGDGYGDYASWNMIEIACNAIDK